MRGISRELRKDYVVHDLRVRRGSGIFLLLAFLNLRVGVHEGVLRSDISVANPKPLNPQPSCVVSILITESRSKAGKTSKTPEQRPKG